MVVKPRSIMTSQDGSASTYSSSHATSRWPTSASTGMEIGSGEEARAEPRARLADELDEPLGDPRSSCGPL
jgi:hypothetical protein